MQEQLKNLPKVDDLLADDVILSYRKLISHKRFKDIIQDEIDLVRQEIIGGNILNPNRDALTTEIFHNIWKRFRAETRESLKPVINATGIIIHTNLGRAPLSSHAATHMATIAAGYNNLEYSIVTGKRRNRLLYIEKMVADLTGAQAAILVNNNAAAVFLTLNSLAMNQEVVLSRGEMVEIGESFRISSIIEKSGCVTKEVGTTNKTYKKDYEQAITAETALLLKVHTSNYKVVGFTSEVSAKEMVALANEHDLITMEDMGSGILLDLSKYGLPKERTVLEAMEDGVDIVTFSGDKMLGGPQAGFICGKKKYIEQIKQNQLLRCMRLDKMSLAATEAILSDYFTDDFLHIPIYRMMLASTEELTIKANKLLALFPKTEAISFRIGGHLAQFGGGSLPDESIDSIAIFAKGAISPQQMADDLRNNEAPIVVVIQDDEIILDIRTIYETEYNTISEAFHTMANNYAHRKDN